MGLQGLGAAAGGFARGGQAHEQMEARKRAEERRRKQDQLQELLQLVELEQSPGISVLGADEELGGRATPIGPADGPLAGFELPEGVGGGEDRLAAAGEFLPSERPVSEAPEGGGVGLLEGLDLEEESRAGESRGRDLGTFELAGEERRLLFDESDLPASEAEVKEAQNEAAFEFLHEQNPDQFPERVEGFNYLSELDEFMTERRDEARAQSEEEAEQARTARRDRAFRMLRQGRSIEQVSDSTGLPSTEVGEIASDVRGLRPDEEEQEDPVMENVLQAVEPKDDFELEVARRIRRGEGLNRVLENIARDVSNAASQQGLQGGDVAAEIERLQEKARAVFQRLSEASDDVVVRGSFANLQELGFGG